MLWVERDPDSLTSSAATPIRRDTTSVVQLTLISASNGPVACIVGHAEIDFGVMMLVRSPSRW